MKLSDNSNVEFPVLSDMIRKYLTCAQGLTSSRHRAKQKIGERNKKAVLWQGNCTMPQLFFSV